MYALNSIKHSKILEKQINKYFPTRQLYKLDKSVKITYFVDSNGKLVWIHFEYRKLHFQH